MPNTERRQQFHEIAPTFTHTGMKILQVAVGVVKNAEGRVLISLRNPSLHQGDLWEFPGGKIEPGESAIQALHRELKEELDITVQTATPLITIHHHYPDRTVNLNVFLVERFQGMPKHSNGQPIRWVESGELSHYRFPAANRPIVTATRLPPYYAILDDANETQLLDYLKQLLANGIKLIQARLKSLPKEKVELFISEAYPLCKQQGAVLLINSAVAGYGQLDTNVPKANAFMQGTIADGIHLTSRDLMSLKNRPDKYEWIAASCHNLEELIHAQKIGLDFAVLAPVLPTLTHPTAKPLGWKQFSGLVSKVNIPVYALGGMSKDCLHTARQEGGQGIAGIRAFLE